MVPVGLWQIIIEKIAYKKSKLQLFYNAECRFCLSMKICISHFDIFKAIDFIRIQENTSKQNISRTFYAIDKKGKQFLGNNAYKKVTSLIPFFYPIALLAYIPGVFNLLKFLFKLIISDNSDLEKFTKPSRSLITNTNRNISDDDILYKSISYRSFKIRTAKVVFVALLFFQFSVSFSFPFSESIVIKAVKANSSLEKPIKKLKNYKDKVLNKNIRRFFGITGHGVFIDSHYKGFNKVFNISYQGELLPLYDQEGMPDYYLKGGIWANYNFRVNGPYVLDKLDVLKSGLIRYASFWAHKNGIDLNTAEFKVHMKDVNLTFEWKENFLKENLSNPWKEAGTIKWKGNKAKVVLKDIDQ
ncbi:hypothetical protein GCM10022397_03720 [Flavivirga jejuensis]